MSHWSRIEDASLNASAPPEQRWVDGWLLRLSPGKAQRARSVNPVADGVLPIAQRLALCEGAFTAAQLPMLVRLTPFSQPPGLDALLAERGYSRHDESWVMVAQAFPPVEHDWPVGTELAQVSHEAYAHIIGEFRGSTTAEIAAHAQRLTQAPVPYCGCVLRANATALACAQYVVEADMVGLYDVFTAPAHRGQGLAARLCTQLLHMAHEQGARTAYLQVDALNTPAQRVYERLGFTRAYNYHYRRAP